MKRLISFAVLVCLLLVLPCPAYAAENRVIDEAGLLSSDEVIHLNDQIHGIKTEYELDIVILTVNDLEGKSAQTYADDYYDEKGYGCGENATGVLLLIAMDTREWYISTCGDAIYALTDYSLEVLGDELVYFLSSGDYYGAFENFVNSLPKYMLAYQQGDPYDGYAAPDEYVSEYGEETVYYPNSGAAKNPLIAIGVGFVVAVIAILIMRSGMNTAKAKHSAADYLKDGSYRLHTQRDMYLYSHTSRTRRQQNNSGGSSVHRSSGGSSHGGRGGRF